jgi:hypothetical protein
MIVLFLFLALSDTPFTRDCGLYNEDFSLDEGNDEVDTTTTLLNNARQSVNIADKTGKRSAPVQNSGGTKKARSATTEASNPPRKKKKTNLEKSGNKAINFLNSDNINKEF